MDDTASAVETIVRHYNTPDLSEARMFRKIMREMRPYLNEIQMLVLLFVFDRTYTYGKTSEVIPMRHFLNGVTTGDGVVLHPPIKKDRATIYRALDFLVDNVIILRSQNSRNSAPTLAINPVWVPQVSHQRDSSVASVRQQVGCNATLNNKNITHEYEQVAPAHTRDAIPCQEEVQMSEAADRLRAAVAGATEKSHAARDKRKRKLSPTGLEKIWEDAFRDAYPDDTFFRWRIYEQSAFAKAVGRGVPRNEVQAFIDFCVRSFDNVINVKFAWMKSKPECNVGFVTKHIAEFYQAFEEDRDPNRKLKRRIREAPVRQAPVKETNDAEVSALQARIKELEAKVGQRSLAKSEKRKRLNRQRPTSSREFGKWED
jgi:hypothetical protein